MGVMCEGEQPPALFQMVRYSSQIAQKMLGDFLIFIFLDSPRKEFFFFTRVVLFLSKLNDFDDLWNAGSQVCRTEGLWHDGLYQCHPAAPLYDTSCPSSAI